MLDRVLAWPWEVSSLGVDWGTWLDKCLLKLMFYIFLNKHNLLNPQDAFFNFWRRGTVSEISAKKRNFANFGPWAPQKGKYPYFSKFFDETRSDCPGHQKNDPDLQRRRTLKRERRNGRFSVGPKIAKRAKNPKKKVEIFFEISRNFLKN